MQLSLPPELARRLGPDASEGLIEVFAQHQELFEARLDLRFAEFRGDMHRAFGLMRVEMERMRSDLIKWNLLLWTSQFAAMVAVMSYMLGGR